jgi:hypothetical protein
VISKSTPITFDLSFKTFSVLNFRLNRLFRRGRKSNARLGNSMCAMQGSFSFFRKRTGYLLSEKYARAATLRRLSLSESGDRIFGKFGVTAFSDYLRSLRQARPCPVSAESRAVRAVQRMSPGA